MHADEPAQYFTHARDQLLDLFPRVPRRLLEIGCGAGATLASAKARWPGLETIGVELDSGAASAARAIASTLIQDSAERVDLQAAGLADIDAVLLADVLEHLVDPWSLLERLHAVLSQDAAIVASIPNIANFWVIEELAAGRFAYEDEGLLDRTHLRFFTRATIAQMFATAGYAIDRWERSIDGRARGRVLRRFLGRELPTRVLGRMFGRRVTARGISRSQHDDLQTLQFFVLAHPSPKRGG